MMCHVFVIAENNAQALLGGEHCESAIQVNRKTDRVVSAFGGIRFAQFFRVLKNIALSNMLQPLVNSNPFEPGTKQVALL